MIDFQPNLHRREELLDLLPSLEHLTCDNILEAQICLARQKSDGELLPNLKTINGVSVNKCDAVERAKAKQVQGLYRTTWKFC